MNRRSFFKRVTGFVAGVCGISTAKPPKIEWRKWAHLDREPEGAVKPLLEGDCERKDCIHYGGLGCHGCDDHLNQTACKLELNKAIVCMRQGYTYYEAKKVLCGNSIDWSKWYSNRD